MKNLLKFGLLSLIFKNLKIFIYIVGGTAFLIIWWVVGQLPEEPEIPPIEEVLAEVDNNLITECKDKLYLVAINYDTDYKVTTGSLVRKQIAFAGALDNFYSYYHSDQVQKEEKESNKDYGWLYLTLTKSTIANYTGVYSTGFDERIVREFGFVANEDSIDTLDALTIVNLHDIQEMYVVLKYYPDKPGSDLVKLFCYFYK